MIINEDVRVLEMASQSELLVEIYCNSGLAKITIVYIKQMI